MLLAALATIGAVIAGILIYAATRPGIFTVQRSATISAQPAHVFDLIQDFHAWKHWSPWEGLDPNMKTTHSGAQTGKGAVYEWQGNKKVGSGRMEITRAAAPSEVVIDLQFLAPFASRNITSFTILPDGDGSRVTWHMEGPNTFMTKVMGVFVSMDSMVGRDFEKGLRQLKELAQQPGAGVPGSKPYSYSPKIS
jgi:uncharacterized protein YndB with AHSA1/START domain